MRKLVFRAVAIAVGLGPAVAFAQSAKTRPTTATYITKEEVDVVNRQGPGIDRNIKVVDIGQENFTVGIIHRGKTANGVAVPVAGAAANAAPAAGRGAAAPAKTSSLRQNFAWTTAGTFVYAGCQWAIVWLFAKLGNGARVLIVSNGLPNPVIRDKD